MTALPSKLGTLSSHIEADQEAIQGAADALEKAGYPVEGPKPCDPGNPTDDRVFWVVREREEDR